MKQIAATFIYHREYNIEVELPDELTDEEIQNTLKDFAPYCGCTSIEWTELEA